MAPPFKLLLITDEGPDLLARVERALSHAPPESVAVQLRRKSLPAGELFALAEGLRKATARVGASLLVNDRLDVALAVGADGVHLPGRGLPPEEARKLLGRERLLGVSCHSHEDLVRSAAAGADYATLAPVHPVPGKGPPLGVSGFAGALQGVNLPVYALGGVTHENATELLQAGAYGIAVIRHVLGADDPAQTTSRLVALLKARAQR